MALPQFLFSIGGIIALVFVVYTAHNIAHLLLRLFCTYSTFGRIFLNSKGINTDLNILVSNVSSVKMVLELDKEIEEQEFKNSKRNPLVFKESLIVQNLNFGYDINKPLF
jgi:predicted sulfurtransferase